MSNAQPISSLAKPRGAVQSAFTRAPASFGAHAAGPRNEVISSSSIPKNVLLKIFCLVRDDIIAENEKALLQANSPWALHLAAVFDNPKRIAALRWVYQVTHVCSLWRAVAIDSGFLWSDMSLLGPHWAQAALDRSRDFPLTIHHVETQQSPCVAIRDALGLMHRLQSVKVVAPTKSSLSKLMERFSGNARLLESLSIKCEDKDTEPRVLDGLDAPQLAKLHLDSVSVPWKELAHCRQMIELHLKAVPGHNVFPRPLPRTFFFTLVGMASSLQFLDLEGCLPHGKTPSDISINRILLPNLRVLKLCDTATSVADALELIRWPAATCVSVKFTDCEMVKLLDEEDDDGGDLNLDLLVRFLENFKASVIGFEKNRMRGLVIAESEELFMHDFYGVRISMFTTVSQDSLCDDTPSWAFEYDPAWPVDNIVRVNQAILEVFCGHLGFASVRALLLDNCTMIERQQWVTLFGELESVYVHGGSVEGLVEAVTCGGVKLASSAEIVLILEVPDHSLGRYTMAHVKRMMRRYTQIFRPDLRLNIQNNPFFDEGDEGETYFFFSSLHRVERSTRQ